MRVFDMRVAQLAARELNRIDVVIFHIAIFVASLCVSGNPNLRYREIEVKGIRRQEERQTEHAGSIFLFQLLLWFVDDFNLARLELFCGGRRQVFDFRQVEIEVEHAVSVIYLRAYICGNGEVRQPIFDQTHNCFVVARKGFLGCSPFVFVFVVELLVSVISSPVSVNSRIA